MSPATRASLALATLAVIAAGCSSAPPKPELPMPGVEVRRIERIRWDEPPQPNLFRIDFSPELTREIRRSGGERQARDEMDAIRAELVEMERIADRELRVRSLCIEGARMISVVEGTNDAPSLAGYFRCKPKGFF